MCVFFQSKVDQGGFPSVLTSELEICNIDLGKRRNVPLIKYYGIIPCCQVRNSRFSVHFSEKHQQRRLFESKQIKKRRRYGLFSLTNRNLKISPTKRTGKRRVSNLRISRWFRSLGHVKKSELFCFPFLLGTSASSHFVGHAEKIGNFRY